ncbi:hypothetical protein GUJ93_ZPchr0011g28399 [Zizania palustris]|uniref:Uncharacterized protein n=1 Tax=Zizania palustris TaxID=103762 RepID=A0A8J6BQE5_ZIZPA|nr:hypothetical protein GUJ93_ZPchr0011g28399 [Zizania palustris]
MWAPCDEISTCKNRGIHHTTSHGREDQERIGRISYDNKSNTVVIVGPFDAQRLCGEIRCENGGATAAADEQLQAEREEREAQGNSVIKAVILHRLNDHACIFSLELK